MNTRTNRITRVGLTVLTLGLLAMLVGCAPSSEETPKVNSDPSKPQPVENNGQQAPAGQFKAGGADG